MEITALSESPVHSAHECFIYDTVDEQIATTAAFLKTGLERNERCIFLEIPEKLARVRDAMSKLGVDTLAAERRCALILSSERDYLEGDGFDIEILLRFLKMAYDKTLADGYTAYRFAGDIHWALGLEQDVCILPAHESKMDTFVADRKMVAMCQYQGRTIAANGIEHVLRTHPIVRLGKNVCNNDLYYEPVAVRREPDPVKAAQLRSEWMYRQLRLSTGAENARNEAHQQTEERFQLMVEEISDYAIYMLDPQGIITTWNIGAQRIKGYQSDEIIGKHFSLFFTPEDAASHKPQRLLDQALSDGRAGDEGWRVRKDHSRFWANVVVTAIYDKAKNLRGFAKVTRDMTERRNAEESLRRKNEEVQQSQKLEAIGLLAGGIAHDFNNLLTGIMGCTEIVASSLKEGGAAEASLEELDAIRKAGSRAMALTKQLLAFSRRQTIAPKPTNLNTVINDLSSMLRRLIREDIQMTLALDPALDVIQADRSQLEQVLLNLMVNARDAMPKGGTLAVETHNAHMDRDFAAQMDARPGPYVVLSVADTGIGMTEEVRVKIFEPFFTTKASSFGTGLGLATVHGIIKQNQGAISVFSKPDRGTTFKIWFPSLREVKAAVSENFPLETLITSGIPRGTETLLIVEDEVIVAKYAAKILRGLGYTVFVARDAHQALILLKDSRIHLLLTDVILPEINGRQLAREVLAKYPLTKLLFMSGYPADVVAQYGVLEPGIVLLEKPFNASQLGNAVREILDSSLTTQPNLSNRS